MLLLKAGATIFSGIYDKSKRKKSKCIPTSVNSKSPTNPSSINDFVEGSVIEAFVNSKLCAVKVIRSFGEGSYQQIKVPILFPYYFRVKINNINNENNNYNDSSSRSNASSSSSSSSNVLY